MKINLIIASGLITLSAFAGKDNDLLKKKISPDNPTAQSTTAAWYPLVGHVDDDRVVRVGVADVCVSMS